MNNQETLLTPATQAVSDDGALLLPRRRKWGMSGKFRKSSSSKGAEVAKASSEPLAAHDPAQKKHRSRNIVKRAIHNIGKRRKRSLRPAVSVDSDPPKIEDLGIDPRLLEKWMVRQELKKNATVTTEKQAASRGAATLVFVGLSSGALVWLEDRVRRWRESHGVVLAACIVAVAVGIACAVIVRRCA